MGICHFNCIIWNARFFKIVNQKFWKLGIKNSESEIKNSVSIESNDYSKTTNTNNNNNNVAEAPFEFVRDGSTGLNKHVYELPRKLEITSKKSLLDDDFEDENTTDINFDLTKTNGIETPKTDQSKCKFNGYSDKEILMFFLMALGTSLMFLFDQADYIYKVNSFVLFFC